MGSGFLKRSRSPADGSKAMSPRRILRTCIRRLRVREDGMAIPTVLALVGVSTAFVAVSMTASVASQRGSLRDQDAKSALGASDAGLGQALLRQNRYATSSSAPCIYKSGSQLVTGPASTDGWCPSVTETVGSASYTYRVTPSTGSSTISVVSTATADGIVRRTAINARPVSGASMLADEGVIGQDTISLSGNPDIRVNTGTNGDVTMQGSASICGNIRHGVGKHVTGSGQCAGYQVTEENRILPPLILPAGIAASNSNYRLASCTSTNVPAGCGLDTYSKNRSSTTPWNAATRTISVGSNATLTMGGGDYFICRFDMSNGDLIMPSGSHIRIFFDTPENCGMAAGATQISMGGNAHISATAFNPGAGNFDLPGFYAPGSTSIATSMTLGGNSGANEFVVYAPNTNVSFQGNSTLYGLLAAKTLSMGGNPTIASISGLPPQNFSTFTTYRRDRYVECTGPVNGLPNTGC